MYLAARVPSARSAPIQDDAWAQEAKSCESVSLVGLDSSIVKKHRSLLEFTFRLFSQSVFAGSVNFTFGQTQVLRMREFVYWADDIVNTEF